MASRPIDEAKAIEVISALREARGEDVDLVPEESVEEISATRIAKGSLRAALDRETFKKLGKSPAEVFATGIVEVLRNPNHKHFKGVLQMALDRVEGPVTQAMALALDLPQRTIIKGEREVAEPPPLPGSEE